jgi:hypothetical protein
MDESRATRDETQAASVTHELNLLTIGDELSHEDKVA